MRLFNIVNTALTFSGDIFINIDIDNIISDFMDNTNENQNLSEE